MSDEIQDTTQAPALESAGWDAQSEQGVGRERDSLDLALRFTVGLLTLGGEEAARRLQELQRKLDTDPTLWSAQAPAGQKSLRRQAWHLGVGLARRGQKRLRRGLGQGYDLSRRAVDRVSATPGGRIAGLLTRPVRKPVAARLAQWSTEAARIEREGELEERKGRALASGVLATLILDLMDEIAKNPELLDFIQDLLSQQGRGMATSVVDNTRSVALTADDTVDALLRWLLRRTPRRDLPPSPVEGQPQTMYAPTARVDEGGPDVD
jgi:hypothetical protein